jgi:hypothetical protein
MLLGGQPVYTKATYEQTTTADKGTNRPAAQPRKERDSATADPIEPQLNIANISQSECRPASPASGTAMVSCR